MGPPIQIKTEEYDHPETENEENMECDPLKDMFPYDSEIMITTCDPIYNYFDTLKSSVQGLAVLNYYKNHRTLNDNFRNIFSDIVVLTEMRSNQNLRISPERLNELALLVPQIFILEIPETYYAPYYREGTRKILPRGKFYTRYNHWRDILIQSGSTPNCRGSKRKIVDQSTPVRVGKFQDVYKNDCAPQEYEEQIKYLKENDGPWELIQEYWSQTSLKRIQDLINNNKITCSEYLSTYPALRKVDYGLKLIDIDFKNQYPNKARCLIDKYSNLEKKLLAYCEHKKKKTTEIKSQLNLFKENNDKSEDVRSAIIFRLIPLLLPTPPLITSQDKSNWRPNKDDVIEGFLLHVKNEEQLNEALLKRKQKLQKFGLSEQPLSVLIGDSLNNIDKRLVVINDIRYVAESTIECVDLTFKSFYSLQLEFSREAAYPWKFLKDAIYSIESDDDIMVPALQTFVNDLSRIGVIDS